MVIEAKLTRELFFRLSLLRHFQRPMFYFGALTAALLTSLVYLGYTGGLVLLVAWIPFGMYVLFGLINAWMGSGGNDRPYLLKTRYEFSGDGLTIRNKLGESTLSWERFSAWSKVVGCFVLTVQEGAIIAIPEHDLSRAQIDSLTQLLNRHITA
jgi:hypothetical protein